MKRRNSGSAEILRAARHIKLETFTISIERSFYSCYEKCRNKRDEKEESISETFFPLCQIHLQKEVFGNLDDQLIDFIERDRRQVSHIMYLQDLGYKKANSSLAI